MFREMLGPGLHQDAQGTTKPPVSLEYFAVLAPWSETTVLRLPVETVMCDSALSCVNCSFCEIQVFVVIFVISCGPMSCHRLDLFVAVERKEHDAMAKSEVDIPRLLLLAVAKGPLQMVLVCVKPCKGTRMRNQIMVASLLKTKTKLYRQINRKLLANAQGLQGKGRGKGNG